MASAKRSDALTGSFSNDIGSKFNEKVDQKYVLIYTLLFVPPAEGGGMEIYYAAYYEGSELFVSFSQIGVPEE